MLVPVVTTAEGIPHGLRAIGTIPPVFIMAALGIWAVKERAEAIGHPYMMQISAWKQKLILYTNCSMNLSQNYYNHRILPFPSKKKVV